MTDTIPNPAPIFELPTGVSLEMLPDLGGERIVQIKGQMADQAMLDRIIAHAKHVSQMTASSIMVTLP